MDEIKVFEISITGTFTVYAYDNDFQIFSEAIKRKDETALISMEPVEMNSIKIETVFPDEARDISSDVYRLEVSEYDRSCNQYIFEKAEASSAVIDFNESNLSCYKSDATEEDVESPFFWRSANFHCQKLRKKYSRVLAEPSTIPIIENFDSDNFFERCAISEDLFRYWKSTRKGMTASIDKIKSIDQNMENRWSYFKLRYPKIEELFEMYTNEL